MLFLTIPSTNGETLTINPNQIIFVGDFGNGECWIQLPKSTIRISEDIYTDILRHLDRVVIDVAEPKINGVPKDLKCEDLELTVRTANCLHNANIIYVHQLLDWSKTDLLKTKNFGRKSLNELTEILKERFNIKLKGE
jgi:DNA-directed RNA polymerase alpha subunit